MNKHRFLEDFVEWFYNKIFHYRYNEYGDDYGITWMLIVISLLIVIAVLAGLTMWVYNIIDKRTSKTLELTGNLIDKKYVGEENHSGTGTALVSTGSGVGVGLASTSSHEDEKFLFFIQSDKVYKCPVDMQNYYHFNIGDTINFSVLLGGKSGDQLEINLV